MTPLRHERDAVLHLERLTLAYEDEPADVPPLVADLTFTIGKREVVSVLGPNGSGKSSTLRYLVGLADKMPAWRSGYKRLQLPLGYVAQDYRSSIMPWLSLLDNIAVPHRLAGKSRLFARRLARDAAERLDMDLPFHSTRPSGGQMQSVAITREVCRGPAILILDEAFNGLDYLARFRTMASLRRWARETQAGILSVSHNAEEAAFFSDRVVILGQQNPTTIATTVDVAGPAERSVGNFGDEWSAAATGAIQRAVRNSVPGTASLT